MQIGAQLYTTRALCKTRAGLLHTLEQVAQIGYPYVQLSGFPYDAADVKSICDTLGLGIRLTHTPPDRILQDTAAVIAEHKQMECPHIGLGCLPNQFCSPTGAREFLKTYANAIRQIKAAGLRFQYHNHDFEFVAQEHTTIFETLLRESDPDVFGFTLDTMWVQASGWNVVDTIQLATGRIQVCHIKDMKFADGERRFAAIGDGILDWTAIFSALETEGVAYAFAEQDNCYGVDPIEELRSSYKYWQSTGRI
jgi:sugar phosphate isomerase/epimerase